MNPAGLIYFNPRSPHGERRKETPNYVLTLAISIHAPRTGSDRIAAGKWLLPLNFNPRSPHGERHAYDYHAMRRAIFQSTLPARGATCFVMLFPSLFDLFQSTLPARGATLPPPSSPARAIFQSTLPARGATNIVNDTFSRFYNFNPRSPHGERQLTFVGRKR